MKIVYCLPQLYRPGGIERMVTIKANYLADVYGYDVTLVVAHQQEKAPFYELSQKVKVVDFGINYDETLGYPILKRLVARSKFHTLHKQRLTKILFEIRPDITISTLTHEAAFLPSIKDGSKKVLEFHFCRGHKRIMADSFKYPFLKKMAYYLKCWQEEHLIIPKYDQFVVLTEEDKAKWKSNIQNVTCIQNILPFENEGKADLNNKTVIAVGRLDAQKGFDKLLDVSRYVKEKHPDWKFNIFGDGQDRKLLLNQISHNGLNHVVTINPSTQAIKEEYLNASIFVMTSRYEGMPMTMLEAMSLGLPIVSYDFPNGPKDLISNEKNGFLIKDNDVQSMVDSFDLLMNDTEMRKVMGSESFNKSRMFTRDLIMQKWKSLFDSLVNERLN